MMSDLTYFMETTSLCMENKPLGHHLDLYRRLIERLEVALENTDRNSAMYERSMHQNHQQENPCLANPIDENHDQMVDIHGLTHAELALLQAFIAKDTPWLQGWHHAAAEMAIIEADLVEPTNEELRAEINELLPMQKLMNTDSSENTESTQASHIMSEAHMLCCAICDTPIPWHKDKLLGCQLCGSRLYRPLNP